MGRRLDRRGRSSMQEDATSHGHKACAECTANCFSIHTKERSPYCLVNRFFKVMLTDDFSDVLFLPPRFARTVLELINKRIYLENSLGQQYGTEISEIDGSLAIQEGWHEFSVNNGVERGDFLVFYLIRCVEKPYIIVQIFGRSGCEKLNSLQEKCLTGKRSRDTTGDAVHEACKKQAVSSVGKQSLSTDVVPKSDVGDSRIELATKNDAEKLPLVPSVCEVEEPLFLLDKDGGENQDNGICVHDPSSAKKMGNSSDADETIGIINGGKGTSSSVNKHTKSQNGSGLVDRFPVSREVLSPGTPQFGEDIDKHGKVEESGPVNDASDISENDLIVVCSGDHSLNCSPIRKMENNGLNFGGSPVSTPMHVNQLGEMSKKVKEELVESTEKLYPPQILNEKPPTSALDNVQVPLAVDENGELVKPEPEGSLDRFSSSEAPDAIAVVVDDQQFLELPSPLPSVSFRGLRERKRPVCLIAEDGRVWPVMYHEGCGRGQKAQKRSNSIVLTSSWKFLKSIYHIQPGDSCHFRLEDPHKHLFRLSVIRQKLVAGN